MRKIVFGLPFFWNVTRCNIHLEEMECAFEKENNFKRLFSPTRLVRECVFRVKFFFSPNWHIYVLNIKLWLWYYASVRANILEKRRLGLFAERKRPGNLPPLQRFYWFLESFPFIAAAFRFNYRKRGHNAVGSICHSAMNCDHCTLIFLCFPLNSTLSFYNGLREVGRGFMFTLIMFRTAKKSFQFRRIYRKIRSTYRAF